jgi:hypothetical protein
MHHIRQRGLLLERDTYIIVVSDECWMLYLNGHVLAAFTDRQDATRAASVAARMSERRGRTAEIQFRSVRNSNVAIRT